MVDKSAVAMLKKNELQDRTGQNVDDVTLGKLLTQAHRGQADCCEPGGMSVSRRRLLCSMEQGNLMEKEWSIDQGNLMSRLT